MHLVRTQPGGGGFSNCVWLSTAGGGGLGHEYVRKIDGLAWNFAKEIMGLWSQFLSLIFSFLKNSSYPEVYLTVKDQNEV